MALWVVLVAEAQCAGQDFEGVNLATHKLALSPNVLSPQREHVTVFLGINFQKVCSLRFQLFNTIYLARFFSLKTIVFQVLDKYCL